MVDTNVDESPVPVFQHVTEMYSSIAAHLRCVGMSKDKVDGVPCDKPAYYIQSGYSLCRECLEVFYNG